MKLDDLVFHVGWETLSKTGVLSHGDGVICAYLVNAFFHESSGWLNCHPSQRAWVGASLQAACRFAWWVIFLQLASLLYERLMLQMTL